MSERLPAAARLFVELAEIVSPPKGERAVADRVLAELRALGLRPVEDDAGARTGGSAGNVHARVEAHPDATGDPILLCAHLDTIDPGPEVRTTIVDGVVRAARGAVLGADDKAAVAGILDGVRRVLAGGRPHPGIDLLFTVQEELGLAGAALFDVGRLAARRGYLYDIDGVIGGLVASAPSHRVLTLRYTGRAAHASLPEQGASAVLAAAAHLAAVPHGRVDADTTVNVGTIHGGTALNVVAERAEVALEIRSRDDDRGRALAETVVAAAGEAARRHGCTVTADVQLSYRAYRHDASATVFAHAAAALAAVGAAPYPVEPLGGSDANILNAAGLSCVNLVAGMRHMHTPEEAIAVADLQTLSDLTVALAEAAA